MNHRSLLSMLCLLSLPACGALLQIRPKGSIAVGVSANGAAADHFNTANAPSVATSQPTTARASVAAPTTGATQLVVAQIHGLRVRAAGDVARARVIAGGAVAIELAGGTGPVDIRDGEIEIDAAAVEGEACDVRGGTVVLANGARQAVTGGRVTLARVNAAWTISSGRLQTTVATGTANASATASATARSNAVATGTTTAPAVVVDAPVASGQRVAVAQVSGLSVRTPGANARMQSISGGSVVIEVNGITGAIEIVGGELEIDAGAVEGESVAVHGGTVVLLGGARRTVTGGRITLARVNGAWTLATGRIQTTVVGAVPAAVATVAVATPSAEAGSFAVGRIEGVDVERIDIAGSGHVIAGGQIVVSGVPRAEGITVLDGSIEVDDAEITTASRGARMTVRATAQRRIRVRAGGALLVTDRRGRRWRARIESGELFARTEGTNPSGRVVWEPIGGELRVTITASGDARLALEGGSLPEATIELTPRVRGALDMLVHSVPADSREAQRLAAAVEVVVRNAESAEPAFYAIPVRGNTLVLMVDISYSMSDADPQGAGLGAAPSKLDVARAELVKVLASVPAHVRVNVLAFSSTQRFTWTAPRSIDDAALREAVQWIASLRPADETLPLEAMQAAVAQHPDQIVLLSDGRPSSSNVVLRQLVSMVDGIAARTRVDVVGFGADQDRQFLGLLAAHGRGTLRLR